MTPAITGPPAVAGSCRVGAETVPAQAPRRGAPGSRRAGRGRLRSGAAGGGTLNDENAPETARWYLPEAMLRHEGGAEPANLRILRARGDSMEPAVHDGDRLLVDVARKTPATGEMAVLWDGNGLVVKRVEVPPQTDPPRLRLISANPMTASSARPTSPEPFSGHSAGCEGLGSSTRRHGSSPTCIQSLMVVHKVSAWRGHERGGWPTRRSSVTPSGSTAGRLPGLADMVRVPGDRCVHALVE